MTGVPASPPAPSVVVFRFRGGEVDAARRELRLGGAVRPLEPRVFDVLWHLLLAQGRVVTRDELLQRFWPHEDTSDGALSRSVMKLRRALGTVGEDGVGIALVTVHRLGYRLDARDLVAEVDPIGSPEARFLAVEQGPWDKVRPRMIEALRGGPPSDALIDAFAQALSDDPRDAAWEKVAAQLTLEERAGEEALAACGRYALAHARMNRVGVDDDVDRSLTDAARLADRSGQRALAIQVRVTQANIEARRQQLGSARRRYEALLAQPDIDQYPVQVARLMNNLGILDAMAGNIVGARSRFERSLRACRLHGLLPLQLAAASNLAMMQVDMACLADAVETVESVLGLMPRVQPPRLAADSVLTACVVLAEAALPDRMQPLLALFGSWEPDERQPVQVLARVTQALHHAAMGEDALAAEALRRAVRLCEPSQERMRIAQWAGLWARAALRSGDAAALQEALDLGRRHGRGDEHFAGEALHALAASAHLQGNRHEALGHLEAALGHLHPGRMAARVRHDAAWLCVESGDQARARALLREVPNWREEHPLGWRMRARLRAAEGDAIDAARWQARVLQRLGRHARDFDRRLLKAYQEAGPHPAMPPPSPLLPSLLLPSL